MKLLFFDTETTSIRPGRICQLSYIVVDSGVKPQQTFGKNYFFTVDEMDPSAEAVHGFSLEKLYDLSNGNYFEDSYEEFLEDFIQADFIIGHNVSFDIKFLSHELLYILGEEFSAKRTFCTMNYYKDIIKLLKNNGEYKNPKLQEVVDYLEISKSKIEETADKLFEGSGNYHDARFDTAATYLIVVEGIKKKLIPAGYFSSKV
ncbi:3'-5' exonuclease [Clostridium sp. YIM B02551]|uniref:3'-5' exonuclease n=1 Tax=Clostridium sp. YIM B02551 TaxID=2910679 RepID=UPI001EEC4FAB|nr:3'-5' exonuclease [Clostridium sp. YIM B02551]